MYNSFLSFNKTKFTNRLEVCFLIVFCVNFIFKIIDLGYSSFWYDEIISVQSASLDFGHIKHVSEWDKNPPFYYYCLSVWIKLLNDSEFTVRLLSVIFSSLAAGTLFLLANNYFNKTTAVISSLLFLSSNILFYYSHEARAYSLVLLLALISTYLYFSFKENSTLKTILLLGLINFLLIYTHYIAGLVLFFQTLLIFFFFDKKWILKYLISVFLVLGLTILRFTKKQLFLIIDFNSSGSVFWLKKADFNYFKECLSEFLFNDYMAVIFLFVILSVIILLIIKKEGDFKFHIIYALLLSVGSIMILYFLGKITPIFLDRYLIFTLPFLFILIGFGLSFIKNPSISITLIALFCMVCSFKINYKTDKGMDYRNAVKFIKSIKQKGDLIIVKTKDVKPLFGYYYEADFFKKKELSSNETILFCSAWADLSQSPTDYRRVIVIDSFEELNPNEYEFQKKLSEVKKMYYKTNEYKGVKISFYK